MKSFNEQTFLAGLLNRDSDAREMSGKFKPEWLRSAELQPILSAIYEYLDKEKVSPSLISLSEFLYEKDKTKFEARWKSTLDQLKKYDDVKSQIYNIQKAREAAAAYELQHLLYEQRFQSALEKGDSNALKSELSKWLSRHTESEDEGLFSIQEAFDRLVDEYPWQGRTAKISTGIYAIDKWSGGLRSPQLGIIMAPSGEGKSAILLNIARHAAAVESKAVLFISNELTREEQTERLLVRMQKPREDSSGKLEFVSLDMIQNDPTLAYRKLEGYQKELNNRLYLKSINLGEDVLGLEEVMKEMRNERGVWPDLVVLDYIERLSASVQMDRGKTWTYYGQIAKELAWLAKRRKCAIWTAIQSNREGMNRKIDLSMEHAQGSIEHLQEASLVLGARKVQVTDSSGIQKSGLEFIEMKSRHGEMARRKMVLETDLSRMYISDKEIKNIQVIEDEEDIPISGEKKVIKGQAKVKGKI